MRKLIIAVLILFNGLLSVGKKIEIDVGDGDKFVILDEGLSIDIKNGEKVFKFISSNNTLFSKPVTSKFENNKLLVQYDNQICVEAFTKNKRLYIRIVPRSDTKIFWPCISEDEKLKAYLIPEGEGLYVPVNDNYIKSVLDISSSVMPFSGYLFNSFSATVIFSTPLRTSFEFKNGQQRFCNDFYLRDKQPFYEVIFSISSADVLSPSREFKNYLKENGQYVTLSEKISRNPEIKKLAGAIHVYVWGDGRTIKALEELAKLGIKKMWIGYEEKPKILSSDKWDKTDYVNYEFIEYAKKRGYLVGPYDSWHTMQDPKNADSHNTDFGKDFFVSGRVRSKDGIDIPGFAGRGHYVSMMALKQMNNSIVYDRFKIFKNRGINTYFLDCHATGELFDDYSSQHPQTVFEDQEIRKDHLKYLSDQTVLGSETTAYWAVPFLAFAHGNFSVMYNLHYSEMRKRSSYGGWGPSKRPKIFFKQINADKNYALRYDPRYRIPMLQAVFHESCVFTDRWDLPITKFKNLMVDRLLMEMLYGVPSIWAIDMEQIKNFKNVLSDLAKNFTSFHEVIMGQELTKFKFLTDDRTVQKSTFSNGISIIVNFGDKEFDGIKPKSYKIEKN